MVVTHVAARGQEQREEAGARCGGSCALGNTEGNQMLIMKLSTNNPFNFSFLKLEASMFGTIQGHVLKLDYVSRPRPNWMSVIGPPLPSSTMAAPDHHGHDDANG